MDWSWFLEVIHHCQKCRQARASQASGREIMALGYGWSTSEQAAASLLWIIPEDKNLEGKCVSFCHCLESPALISQSRADKGGFVAERQ